MTRIKFDILPSLGQGNSPRTFSTSPTVCDSSIAAGKASVSSVVTNEAMGTAVNSPHPPRFSMGTPVTGLRADVKSPSPLIFMDT